MCVCVPVLSSEPLSIFVCLKSPLSLPLDSHRLSYLDYSVSLNGIIEQADGRRFDGDRLIFAEPEKADFWHL